MTNRFMSKFRLADTVARQLARLIVGVGIFLTTLTAPAAFADVQCGTTGYVRWGSQCVYTTVGPDTFTVPPYQTEVMFTVYGAGDGFKVENRETGNGGFAEGGLRVVPGEVFDLRMGGLPTNRQGPGGLYEEVCAAGGYNGGGEGHGDSCGGAGASDVRPAGGGLADRLFVAGGAGGNSKYRLSTLHPGGDGGGTSGEDGESGDDGDSGGGGTQTAAGASPGNASSAGFGFGGSGGTGISIFKGGAGGGGGYYGGGGTAAADDPAGGGGGSGYITPRATFSNFDGSGPLIFYNGPVHDFIYNGAIIVTYTELATIHAAVALTADHDNPVPRNTTVTLSATVTTTTGAPGVGTVIISRYANASGACPCANVAQGVLDPDGTFSVRINPTTLAFGPHHVLVANFQDSHGVLADTTSNALALSIAAADQTIAFTSSAPTNAFEFGPAYTVSAAASSGLPVSFSIPPASAAVCSVAGSTVSFLAPGVCLINADQAGNASYNAAPTVQQQVQVAEGGGQRMTVTSTPPSNAAPDDVYMATAVGGGSGNPVIFSNPPGDSTCVVRSSGRVEFYFGGTCRILANQAGGNGYAPAPQAEQDVVVSPRAQQVQFLTTPPSAPQVGDTYLVSAIVDSLMQTATLSLAPTSSGCTLTNVRAVNTGLGYFRTDGTVTFTGFGTCIINGNGAAVLPRLSAAPTAQQIISIEGPTATPTDTPTTTPTADDTETPTVAPSETPTVAPSETPTDDPTETPTDDPTGTPTVDPTETPTVDATPAATATPSQVTFTPTPSPGIGGDACPPAPRSGCHQPRRASQISLHAAAPRLRWEWYGALPTTAAGLGDPVTGSTGYQLCIYDTADGLPALAFEASVPPLGTCGRRPCWKRIGKRLAYTNNDATPDGIRHLTLSAGGRRKAASISVSGYGQHLRLPSPTDDGVLLRSSPQVTVQLQRSDAPDCWEAVFASPATSSTARTFTDRIR